MVARVSDRAADNQVEAPEGRGLRGLMTVALIVVLSALFVSRYSQSALPVRQFLLEGTFQYTSAEKLQSMIDEHYQNAGLLSIDLMQLKTDIESIPWVKNVELERIWPDAIRIQVSEKRPYLRFGNDKMIDVDGIVFTPESTQKFSTLPRLDLQQPFTAELFKAYRDMEHLLVDNGYEIKRFLITAQNDWALELSDDIRINIGQHKPLQTFKRFIKVLALIDSHGSRKIQSVDLRYEKGLAVSYKH
ncbi:MAG: FtsQ-type POTRA domain-containing protein [Gammaproteobacteria bacterium]|nr:FtsQ-type POTRA domain-containing protein [Gammaproteobacteria bacterium]